LKRAELKRDYPEEYRALLDLYAARREAWRIKKAAQDRYDELLLKRLRETGPKPVMMWGLRERRI